MITMGKEERGITIATLNYDNTIEMEAEKQRVRCNAGVHGSTQAPSRPMGKGLT
jgi:hypothetical protein